MANLNYMITNFSAGQLSGMLDGRTDIARYFNGVKVLENFVSLPFGGAMRRPGSVYVASTKTNGIARLIPFQFNVLQAYILEFGDEYVRVYKDNGVVLDGASAYELATPYAEEDLFDLQFGQSNDTMWITHVGYKTQKLTRTDHDAWTIGNYAPTADPFTSANNYPGSVAFFENRLVFANTNTNPQSIYTTKSNDYDNMTKGAEADDALEYKISSEQSNAIRWLKSGKKLLMGTFGGGFSMSSGEEGAPLTPTNVSVRKSTEYGSVGIVPHRIGNFVYFIQRNARTVREMSFDFNIDEYKAEDMTILSDQIVKDSIIDMDYQQSPYNILWAVRNDGVLLSFTREADQEVQAWAQHKIGGSFGAGNAVVESVAVIPGDGGDDQVWLVVKRTIGGNTVRYVEYLKPFDFGREIEDAFFIDSGLTLDNPKTITAITKASPGVVTAASHGYSNDDIVIIRGVKGMTDVNQVKYIVAGKTDHTFQLTDYTTGEDVDTTGFDAYISDGEVRITVTSVSELGHLEGEAVQLLLDGSKGVGKTVSASSISIDAADSEAGQVNAGLAYVSTMQSMRIEAGSVTGTSQGKLKKIVRLFARLFESVGMKAGSPDLQDEVAFRDATDDTDKPIPVFSGDKDIVMPGGWDRDGYIVVKQEDPLPLVVLALIAEMGVAD